MEDDKKEETTPGQQHGEASDEGKQQDLADRDPREADNIRAGRLHIPPSAAEED
ncbi:MAG TPA: hypothetical protein VG324_26560 [Blastocatellia bacterium]|nr:hypothetical protein [Blastocatellia bacterium]